MRALFFVLVFFFSMAQKPLYSNLDDQNFSQCLLEWNVGINEQNVSEFVKQRQRLIKLAMQDEKTLLYDFAEEQKLTKFSQGSFAVEMIDKYKSIEIEVQCFNNELTKSKTFQRCGTPFVHFVLDGNHDYQQIYDECKKRCETYAQEHNIRISGTKWALKSTTFALIDKENLKIVLRNNKVLTFVPDVPIPPAPPSKWTKETLHALGVIIETKKITDAIRDKKMSDTCNYLVSKMNTFLVNRKKKKL